MINQFTVGASSPSTWQYQAVKRALIAQAINLFSVYHMLTPDFPSCHDRISLQ